MISAVTMDGVYQGLSLQRAQVRAKGIVKITTAMYLLHNVNNSDTFIPLLCSEIHQSVYFLTVLRSPISGRDRSYHRSG